MFFICFPFGWQIHSQCLFCPFWHFGPYWLSMKGLCWYVWCHIFAGDAFFVFAFLYFNVMCFSCLSLSWYGMVIHFARELLAPSWCCALFRLSFLVHMFGGSCIGRMCHLSCGIHVVYMLPILSEHGLWLDGKWFCLFDIRFVDDFWHGLNYNVVSCTILNSQPQMKPANFMDALVFTNFSFLLKNRIEQSKVFVWIFLKLSSQVCFI